LLAFLVAPALAQTSIHPPVFYIGNQGLADARIRFLARSSGFSAQFHDDAIVLRHQGVETRIRFAGASTGAAVEGDQPLAGRANIFTGADRSRWRTGLPLYGGVRYRELYPGIDLVYGASGRKLKSDFIVRPGADPGRIRLRYEGPQSVRVAEDGGLVLVTTAGELREERPELYQMVDGRQKPVDGSFTKLDDGSIGFRIGEYDRSRTLWIDPVLTYSTYIGGSSGDAATAIAVDGSGSAYVAGWTESLDFPTVGPRQGFAGSVDAFVFKLAPGGNALLYATFLGGSRDDRAYGVAVDATGNVHLAGSTASTNFPVASAFQSSMAGVRDAWVAKLNAAGNTLIFSTYLGGGATDSANAIALDPSGNVYVAGETGSGNFPRLNAFQNQYQGRLEAFITRLSPAGVMQYSSFLGGGGDDRALGVAVDTGGAAYLTGATDSGNFPTASPAQSLSGGGQDAFVAKVSATGTSLVYSTYLGGSGGSAGLPEAGYAIAVDSNGNAYVAGVTSSSNFPTAAPLQAARGGGTDGFVTKLNSSGTARVYSTYLGGASADFATAIRVDASGAAYVAGYTASPNFPLASPLQSTLGGGYDAFVAQINPGGTLGFATYIGGSASDGAAAIAIDGGGNSYVAGLTQSTNFPLVGPVRTFNAGASDAFALKISAAVSGNQPPSTNSTTPSSGTGAAQTFSFVFADPDGAQDLATVEVLFNSGLNTAGACWIEFRRGANELRLMNDAGSGALGPLTPGGAGSVQNSQCSLSAAGSSATASGTNLTLNLAISFLPAFAGTRGIFMSATDLGGLVAAWLQRGTWTVPGTGGAAPPSAAAISPSSGNASAQVFTITATDPNGAADIDWVEVLFNSGPTASLGCYVRYVRSTGNLRLYADNGTTLSSPAAIGSPAQLQNSQCVVNVFGSSASVAGNNLTLNLALVFRSSFSGSRQSFVQVMDIGGLRLNFVQTGTWSPLSTNTAPSPLFVSPVSGTGATQSFTFAAADSSGAASLGLVELLFNGVFATANACYIRYDRAANQLRLLDDAGIGVAGSVTPGSGATAQNTQCTIAGVGSSATATLGVLTVVAAVTFKPAFAGGKTTFLNAVDGAGLSSGFQPRSSWTVPPSVSQAPPSGITISPPTGSAYAQTFTIAATDPNGQADIAQMEVLFNVSLNPAGACYVRYTRSTDTLALLNDAGSSPVGSGKPGTAAALQNGQCVVNLAGSAASGVGTTFTLTLAVVFRAAFAGSHQIFAQATDAGGLQLSFLAVGTRDLPSVPQPPAPLFVTPSSGSGSQQAFSFTYADPNGAADVFLAQMLFNSVLNTNNACWVQYYRNTNELRLLNDSSSAFFGPLTPGGAGSVSNSQCTLMASGSAVTSSGALLTVTVNLFFRTSFAGARNAYTTVRDNGSLFTDWAAVGMWTVPTGVAPTGVSVSPASGSGAAQTFQFTATDPNGGADISTIEVLFNSSLNTANACYVRFDRVNNRLELFNDAGVSIAGSAAPGEPAALQNSQCVVNAADTSSSSAGNDATLTLALVFRSSFAGARTSFAKVVDSGGLQLAFQTTGAWTVPSGNAAPVSLSVSPSTGSGLVQSFSFLTADPNGNQDISIFNVIVNASLNSVNACWVQYYRQLNQLRLLSDDISTFFGPLTPGQPGSVQNSQCILDAGGSSVATNGALLTVNLAISFKTAFEGARQLNVSLTDIGGLAGAYVVEGIWTVPSAITPAAPAVVSVTPSSGSGATQTFSLLYSDTNGSQDLAVVQVIINSTLNSVNSCWVQYYRAANQLRLIADDIQSFLGPLTPGQPGSVQNSQCILDAAGVSVSQSGSNLTLNLTLTFKPAFAGTKGVYLSATDNSGLVAPFEQRGTWTVP
jgi:hypothetical protein